MYTINKNDNLMKNLVTMVMIALNLILLPSVDIYTLVDESSLVGGVSVAKWLSHQHHITCPLPLWFQILQGTLDSFM